MIINKSTNQGFLAIHLLMVIKYLPQLLLAIPHVKSLLAFFPQKRQEMKVEKRKRRVGKRQEDGKDEGNIEERKEGNV